MSLFGKFKGLFGRRGPAIPEPHPTQPGEDGRTEVIGQRLSPAEREFVRERAERLEDEGRRTGNRRLIAQAQSIRARL